MRGFPMNVARQSFHQTPDTVSITPYRREAPRSTLSLNVSLSVEIEAEVGVLQNSRNKMTSDTYFRQCAPSVCRHPNYLQQSTYNKHLFDLRIFFPLVILLIWNQLMPLLVIVGILTLWTDSTIVQNESVLSKLASNKENLRAFKIF